MKVTNVTSEQFYSTLPSFDEFSGVAEFDQYIDVPGDWTLLISDVVGSTKAIEKGQYKQVNMVGAASIICVLNICKHIEVPFSFGGDGGLIIVPPEVVDGACVELQRLQAGCRTMFGLDLRAAAISVNALRQADGDILVRKFRLNDHNNLAMFAGSGTELADTWLKSDDPVHEQYKLSALDEEEPNLEGLSCRWEPLASLKGEMLTLIVKQSSESRSDITGEIARVLGKPLSNYTPISDQTLKFKFPPRGIPLEVAAKSLRGNKMKHFSWAFFTSAMQWLCEKFGVKIGDYDGATYRQELIASTDFRKYDGALRMVLDLRHQELDKLENWLEQEYQQGQLIYGTWRSPSAVMTCMLFDLTQARHLHLVDGSDGGYAMASKDYKMRLASLNNKPAN